MVYFRISQKRHKTRHKTKKLYSKVSETAFIKINKRHTKKIIDTNF